VETGIEYTLSVTNLDGFTHQIQGVVDYLPPGFEYCYPDDPEIDCYPPSGMTSSHPDEIDLVNLNGVWRYKVHWIFSPAVSIASGATETLTFWAKTTKDVSGSYYNEVNVESNASVPTIFSDIGVTPENFNFNYSWTTGAVVVPAYDASSEAGDITINTNMSLILQSIAITSWQVD